MGHYLYKKSVYGEGLKRNKIKDPSFPFFSVFKRRKQSGLAKSSTG